MVGYEPDDTIELVARPRLRRGPRGSFADRLRAARAARGFTQEAAALDLGIGRVTLSRWESGTHIPRGIVLRVVEEWIAASKSGGRHGA